LVNIIVMSLCAVVCGADGWDDIALFAEARADWFETFLELPNGTPSADTFRRVFSALDPRAFERCFRSWVQALAHELTSEVVAVDGKSVKGAFERASPTTPLHLVHVWACDQQLLLAQKAVAGAPGEIAAIPELLKMLDLEGAIVTADANGCTAGVAEAVVDAKADYVLALKANRHGLYEAVQSIFANVLEGRSQKPPLPHAKQTSRKHGRHEIRTVWAAPLEDWPLKGERWKGLRTAVLIKRERTVGDAPPSVEWHTYISSLPPQPRKLAIALRSHWGVENGLHWCLDVGLAEDRRRIRDQNAAENYALLSRVALTLLKRETTVKHGIALKRKNAGWRNDYLLRVLAGGNIEV
jgi:predicted transposase YbfD/YdcC